MPTFFDLTTYITFTYISSEDRITGHRWPEDQLIGIDTFLMPS